LDDNRFVIDKLDPSSATLQCDPGVHLQLQSGDVAGDERGWFSFAHAKLVERAIPRVQLFEDIEYCTI
jgi:hypothetical protein